MFYLNKIATYKNSNFKKFLTLLSLFSLMVTVNNCSLNLTKNATNCTCNITKSVVTKNYQNVIGSSSLKGKLYAIIILGAFWDDGGNNEYLGLDAKGMYSILNSYEIPDDQIYYFSSTPQKSYSIKNHYYKNSSCSIDFKSITHDSISKAFDDIKNKIKKEDKFLFFISTHGNPYSHRLCRLDLCNGLNDSKKLKYSQLQGWLNKIRCKRLFIIINACSSGSFISGKCGCILTKGNLIFSKGKYNKRIVITSCNSGEVSPADIDVCDSNPNDIGSEFISGFFEAFTKDRKDFNNFMDKISIYSAFHYANLYAACAEGSISDINSTCQVCYKPLIKCSTGINPENEYLFWD